MPHPPEEDDYPHDEPRELERWEKHVVSAAATTLTALVALVNPVAGIAAAVVQPGMDFALQKAWGEVFRSRARRVETMLDTAAENAERPAEEVVAALQQTEEGAELLLSAAEAAMATTIPGKLRALGLTLAAAVRDDAKLDEELIFVAAVRAMQRPHMVVLQTQRERDQAKEDVQANDLDGSARVPGTAAMGLGEYAAWIAVPVAYGLVRQISAYGAMAHEVTPFGLKFLERAADAAASPAPDPAA